ncbi:MAG: adenosylcobinamide amidohydrolase [Sporomusaceae bacterium]|jgi:adenosylcobinamide amidohydrolase|nr:adenosylcobinamide amidohydrolase [Sporomusaceae bacterium]
MKLLQLSTGDNVYRYEKSVVIFFEGKRKVLSTSVYNGGYREDITTVFNHDGTRGAGMASVMLAPTYDEHMRIIAKSIGLDPDTVTGMGTAANMNNVAVKSMTYQDLTVTAIVTGGIEVNGGRVGDPADYYKPLPKEEKLGTINIFLIIDADLPPGVLARALVTCTEAKSAAIQELIAGSNYSNGLATGSGTDQTIVIANAESPLYFEGAGKHSKLGELIGKTVIQAVKEALHKQNGLNPTSQHDVLARLKRFGIKSENIWQKYCQAEENPVIKPKFLDVLEELKREAEIVTYASLYIHLYDQYLWQLLGEKEIISAGNKILSFLAEFYQVEFIISEYSGSKNLMENLEDLLVKIMRKKLGSG